MTSSPAAAPARSGWTPSEHQRARDAYRRSRARRSTAVAVVSTVALTAVAVLGLVSSPGWPRVRASFFDADVARAALPAVLEGLWLNVRVMAVSAVLIVVVALALALARTLRGPVFFPLRAFATGYVDVFRGLPLILVLLLVGFGLPGLRLQGIPTSAVLLGGLALVLTYSAYVAEVFRAGIESVHPSQVAAARSLGLTRGQAMRHVVLPQAVRRVVPPLLNDLVALSKDSGLISILGAIDAVRAAQIETARYANFTPYVVAGVLFVILTIPLTRFTDALARRSGWLGAQGALAGGGALR
ncbi:amino acid ABC transporter permease [Cellulomonas fimi]|uniref:Polar amino acid ABC transporter, inner membrane subunit n=1 Tax=Cellulomonas fimi (strain ATCC 484 / DSM 20113 / JCM 1341 / CCUG 24087 / LMG 16345 / NBRC 15513 / NCIMB 8980 / NCTC 7547 / NRS-133) TaxID=590998 RepID=F4H1D1_CELFA|nr:ABC transporter permease subunit [Cellulomonas fimi]AEE45102.1 polar amino acid ABC transporter, inner membrane subunit [Cellulomonas fimi ATCC 484]NNH06335.1 ABC transporter permease subunit [Cellulomonas fimi]VEH28245.1 Arginine transport system permease protein ArtQ [Cellulomonas fimi]